MKWTHLQQINETYLQHAKHALWIWWKLVIAVVALPIHALVPDLFKDTATKSLDAIQAYRNKREWEKNPGVRLSRAVRE